MTKAKPKARRIVGVISLAAAFLLQPFLLLKVEAGDFSSSGMALADVQSSQPAYGGYPQGSYAPQNGYQYQQNFQAPVQQGQAPQYIGMASGRAQVPAPGPTHYHLQAQLLMRQGKLEEANQALSIAVRMYPNNRLLLSDMGQLSLKRANKFISARDYDSAMKVLRQAIYLDSASGQPGTISRQAANQLDNVLRATGVDPKDAKARSALASSLAQRGRTTEATVEYQTAMKIQPLPETAVGLGDLYMQANQKDKAKAEYQKALELNPNYSPAHRQLGVLYNREGDVVGASSELSRAVILDSSDRVASGELISLWQAQVGRNPNDVNAHLGLARAYQLSGDLRSAQGEYRQVVMIDPNNPNLPQARMSFRLAMARQQADQAYGYAQSLDAQGNIYGAIQATQQGLAADPNNVKLTTFRAYLYEKLGQFSQARDGYSLALREDPNNQYAQERLKAVAGLADLPQSNGGGFAGNLALGAAAAGGAIGMMAMGANAPRSVMPGLPGAQAVMREPVQMTQTNTISDLFWKVRGAAVDDSIEQQKKEEKAEMMKKMFMAMKGAPKSSSGGGLDLGSAPPGLPPDIAAIVGGGKAPSGGASAQNLPPGFPPQLAAILGGPGLPPAVAGLIDSMGLKKPDGSLDFDKINNLLDTMGLKKPDGSLDLAKISSMLGGIDLSAIMSGAGAGGPASLPPGLAAMSGTQGRSPHESRGKGTSALAGLPPNIAAIMGGGASAELSKLPVPKKSATKSKSKSASKKTTKATSKKATTTKGKAKASAKTKGLKAKKTVKAQLATSAPQAVAAAPAASPMPGGLPGMPAGGGFNLAGFMPVINMAMQRFINLENQTKSVASQLQQTQQAVREMQTYMRNNPNGAPGGAFVPTSVPMGGQAQGPGIPGQMNMPPQMPQPQMPPINGAGQMPPGLPGAMPGMPPQMNGPMGPGDQPIELRPSLGPASMAPPNVPPSNLQSVQIDPNPPPIGSAQLGLAGNATQPPVELRASMAPPIIASAASGIAAGAAGQIASVPQNVQGIMPTNVPQFTDPGNVSKAINDINNNNDDVPSVSKTGKPGKQNKIRVEVEGVRPDILGLRVKLVVKNDAGFSIPLPDDMSGFVKRLKFYMPKNAEKIPAHGELHCSIKVPIP